MKNGKYQKGDWVKVWSLQSFNGGGFLNGTRAFVKQSQTGDSVILCVERNIGGVLKIDEGYEVYAKQCELIEDVNNQESINDAYKRIMGNNCI